MNRPHQFFPLSKVVITDPESLYFEQEFVVFSPAEEEDSFLLAPIYQDFANLISFHMDQIAKVND